MQFIFRKGLLEWSSMYHVPSLNECKAMGRIRRAFLKVREEI
jgi:hypothetical protein